MLGAVITNEEMYLPVRDDGADSAMRRRPDDALLRTARHAHPDRRGWSGIRSNAIEVATWLQTRPEVSRVLYPALPEDPGHALWKRDFLGASGLFGVVLKPASKEAVYAMIDALDLFGIGASWGGFESLIQPTNPAAHPHRHPLGGRRPDSAPPYRPRRPARPDRRPRARLPRSTQDRRCVSAGVAQRHRLIGRRLLRALGEEAPGRIAGGCKSPAETGRADLVHFQDMARCAVWRGFAPALFRALIIAGKSRRGSRSWRRRLFGSLATRLGCVIRICRPISSGAPRNASRTQSQG